MHDKLILKSHNDNDKLSSENNLFLKILIMKFDMVNH